MGLDMFLERVEKNSFEEDDEKKLKTIMYWRKSYVLMDWFCTKLTESDNLQNCARYSFDIDTLKELYDFCKKYYEYELCGVDEDIVICWYFDDGRFDDEELWNIKRTISMLEDEFKYYEKHIENAVNIFYMFHGWW